MLVGIPSVLLLALAKVIAHENDNPRSSVTFAELMVRYAKEYWALITIPVVCTLAIYINQDFLLDAPTTSEAVRQKILPHDFIQSHGRTFAHDAIAMSYFAYLSIEARCIMENLGDLFFIMKLVPAQLAILALLYINVVSFRFKTQLFGGALATVLVPLAMLLIAWDVERIWTYLAIANLWTCLAIVAVFKLRNPRRLPLAASLIMGYIVLVQNLTPYPLWDGNQDRIQLLMPNLQLPLIPTTPTARVGACPS